VSHHKIITIVAIVALFIGLKAQKEVVTKNEIWTHTFVNVRLNNKFSANVDIAYRSKNLFEATTQTLMRVGLSYHIDNSMFFQVSMAYFKAYPAQNGTNDLNIPEIRHAQRLFVNSTKGIFQISQRYRLEERFIRKNNKDILLDSYKFNFRFGYQLNVQFPFKGKKIEPKKLFGNISDELFVNFGKQITYNYFDQNRIFAGIGYQFNKAANLVLGYQYIYQQLSTGKKFISTNSLRIAFTYNFDLRKQE
jgi:hypothetical protein